MLTNVKMYEENSAVYMFTLKCPLFVKSYKMNLIITQHVCGNNLNNKTMQWVLEIILIK